MKRDLAPDSAARTAATRATMPFPEASMVRWRSSQRGAAGFWRRRERRQDQRRFARRADPGHQLGVGDRVGRAEGRMPAQGAEYVVHPHPQTHAVHHAVEGAEQDGGLRTGEQQHLGGPLRRGTDRAVEHRVVLQGVVVQRPSRHDAHARAQTAVHPVAAVADQAGAGCGRRGHVDGPLQRGRVQAAVAVDGEVHDERWGHPPRGEIEAFGGSDLPTEDRGVAHADLRGRVVFSAHSG
jgi:hypothetical protein